MKLKESSHPEETFDFGFAWGKRAEPGAIFTFFGPLGAGKTTFIKGFTCGLVGKDIEVTSPTFNYLNIYDINPEKVVYHFDLYRLRDSKDFLSLGFEEYLFTNGVVCIEWSERIAPLLTRIPSYRVNFCDIEGDKRIIEVTHGIIKE